MLQAAHYEFKVCLEGVAVPFNQAEISAAMDGPARARIWVTPVAHARFVFPRTLVHVFWKDKGAWRCIFEGEVVGRGFVKRSNERSVAFDCLGFEGYWMQAYRFFFDVEREKPIEGQSRAMAYSTDSIIGDTRVPVDDFLPSAFLGAEKRDTSRRSVLTIPEGFYNLFAKMLELNSFFRLSSARLRLLERIHTVNNDFAQRLLSHFIFAPEAAANTRFGPQASLWQILSDLLGQIYYHYVPVTSPTMGSAAPLNHLFLPEVTWSAPPRCNVFFPEHYAEFTFSHDFMAEPTRTEVLTSFGGEGILSETYFSPAELQEILRGQRHLRDTGTGTGAGDWTFLLPEEILKGVVYNLEEFSSRETLFGSLSSEEQEQLRREYAFVVHFLHHRRRAASRQIPNLVGRFNPNLTCGLPCLVLDPDWGSFTGLLAGYTHTLRAEGHSSTTAHITQVRLPTSQERPSYIPEDLSADLFGAESLAPLGFFDEEASVQGQGLPVWFDDTLNPLSIGQAVYSSALGLPSGAATVMELPDGSQASLVGEAADRLRAHYESLPEDRRHAWAMEYVSRDLATEYDVFDAIGAQPVHSEDERAEFEALPVSERRTRGVAEYSGSTSMAQLPTVSMASLLSSLEGPFLTERQQWARVLRKALTERHVHAK